MKSNIDQAILKTLDIAEVHGIVHLALNILECNDVDYVRRRIRKLSENGLVVIHYDNPPRGRGHKALICRKEI